MLRKTRLHFGFWSVFREEFGKLKKIWEHDLGTMKDQATEYKKFMEGTQGLDAEGIEKKKQKEEAMEQVLEERRKQSLESRQQWKEQLAKLSWQEQVKERWRELKASLMASVGTQAGVVMLIQHCTAAHTAEVAVEQGIDVKQVSIVTEKSAIDHETVVVGYIDAPEASEEEVAVFASRLEKACPAARMHGNIQWRRHGGSVQHDEPSSVPFSHQKEGDNQKAFSAKDNHNNVDVENNNKREEGFQEEKAASDMSNSMRDSSRSSSTKEEGTEEILPPRAPRPVIQEGGFYGGETFLRKDSSEAAMTPQETNNAGEQKTESNDGKEKQKRKEEGSFPELTQRMKGQQNVANLLKGKKKISFDDNLLEGEDEFFEDDKGGKRR